jgi:hypothetical protein
MTKFLDQSGARDCILRWHTHCNHRNRPASRREIVAISLAWDNSLVTPLRLLGRPENVGARSSVLGFW